MNLYKILFAHVAPKDRAKSILGYITAKSDEEVFNILNDKACWDDKDNIDVWDDNINDYKETPYADHMLKIKGDYFFEDNDYETTYYGIEEYGWELVKEDISESEINILTELKILTISSTI